MSKMSPTNLSPYYDLVDKKYLKAVEYDDLVLFNYTNKCTFDGYWNYYTKRARGIVFEKDTGKLVSLCLKKFFNVKETMETMPQYLPQLPFVVQEKLDGSIVFLLCHNFKWHCITRGSWESEQSELAAQLVKGWDFDNLDPNYTYCFELIGPDNKIVVDYKENKLILLAVMDNQSESELPWEDVQVLADLHRWELVKEYNYSLDEILELQDQWDKNTEGVVLRYSNNFRVKAKGVEYLRMAKIIANLSPLSLWATMKDGGIDRKYLIELPEELKEEAESIMGKLEHAYCHVMYEIAQDMQKIPRSDAVTPKYKKEVGLWLKANGEELKHPGVVFPLLLKRDIDEYIKDCIRPKGNVLDA